VILFEVCEKAGAATLRPFKLQARSFLVFFGSAGQEPNVPAPRIRDENPFLNLGSGLTGVWGY
jgi:hypothetical protein